MDQDTIQWREDVFAGIASRLKLDGVRERLEEAGWRLLADRIERETLQRGLATRYGMSDACPVLRRDDSDDILVLVMPLSADANAQLVVEVYDFAEPGWERGGTWPVFEDWLVAELDSARP